MAATQGRPNKSSITRACLCGFLVFAVICGLQFFKRQFYQLEMNAGTAEFGSNQYPLESMNEIDDFNKINVLSAKSDKETTCINMVKTDCYPYLRFWFERLVERKAPANDEELIRFARQLIEEPSTYVMRKLSWGGRSTPQAVYVNELLGSKSGGFFVEAGAQDGERASNTVWLEATHNWTGILVEIDPWFYTQMRGKMRRSYTVNAGLSSTNYVTELVFRESSGGLGQLASEKDIEMGKRTLKIPCLPVETLLLATKRHTVDYFSLDVEGMEYDVLKTIPFSKYDIQTLSVEYSHTNGTAVKHLLAKNGYVFKKQLNVYDKKIALVVEDYMFQKQNN